MSDLSIQPAFDARKPAHQPGADLRRIEPALNEFRARSQVADFIEIRRAIHARAQRRLHFKADLFADPAWDMLLELYAAALTQRKLTVSKLGERSGVPMTTALRWIRTLEKEGLIERGYDRLDGRRVFLILTPQGINAMAAYFDGLEEGAPLL